jgi:ATPase subunit of ABC transporter with duplicated ATPase domains
VLEEYLTEVFDGRLIVVSYDDFFVNRVAEHLFVFLAGYSVLADITAKGDALRSSLTAKEERWLELSGGL